MKFLLRLAVFTLKGQKQIYMPQSLSKVYVHITFSTKNRQHLIDDDWIKTWLSPIQGSINRTLSHRALPCADDLRLSAFTERY
jgi:hypothetical protein